MKTAAYLIDGTRSIWPIGLLMSLALTSCSSILETPENRANELTQSAAQAVRANKFSQAERLYADAVSEAQKSNNLLLVANRLDDLASVYKQDGKAELAAATLRQAIERYNTADKKQLPVNDSLLVQQLLTKDLAAAANLESELGHLTTADQLFQQALSTNEKDVEDWDGRVQIMKNYAALLRKMHKDSDAYNIEIALAGSDLDAAEWDRMFVAVNSYYLNDGKCDPVKEKSINHDLDVLRESMRQFPGRRARTHYSLALRQFALGRPAEAEKELRQCVELFQKIDSGTGPTTEVELKHRFLSDALSLLAHSLDLQGRVDEADVLYQKALSFNRDIPIVRLLTMTNMYRARNRTQLDKLALRIMDLIRKQPEPVPDDVNTLITLATLHHGLGQNREEQTCFAEAIKLEPQIKKQTLSEKAYFYSFLADELVHCGRTTEAEIYYQKGIALCRKEKLYKVWQCGTCLHHYANLLNTTNRKSEAASYESESHRFIRDLEKEN